MPPTNDQRPAVERIMPPKVMVRVANPIMGWLLGSPLHGLVDKHIMLLRFRGRRTGRAYVVAVGRQTIYGRPGALTNSGWRVNFRGGAPVGVTLEGELRRGHAELVEDPEEVARVCANLIEEYGYERAGRRLGIRINVDRIPTREELVDAIGRSRLSLIAIDLGAKHGEAKAPGVSNDA
jgi:hypothetical protein